MQHTLLPSPCTHAYFPHVSRCLLTHATTAILCTRLAATALCRAQEASKTFYRRLIWRDLAYWQLCHWPRMAVEPIRTGYEEMQWESGPQAEAYLKAWQQGRTGFPLVDAGGWVGDSLQSLQGERGWPTSVPLGEVAGWMQQPVRKLVAPQTL